MPRRYGARNPGHKAQQNRTCEQNDGIARVAFCPLPQDRIQAQRERQTDPNSAPYTPQSRRKHDPEYVAALRAQGHANAKLVGPLRHCVGDHAVKRRPPGKSHYAGAPRVPHFILHRARGLVGHLQRPHAARQRIDVPAERPLADAAGKRNGGSPDASAPLGSNRRSLVLAERRIRTQCYNLDILLDIREESAMSTTPQKRALNRYRKRLGQRGMARFEVLGLDADRELIRSLAKRLAGNGPDSARIRDTVRLTISGEQSKKGGILNALRRSPLVGADLDLNRPSTPGRRVDL